MNGSTDFVLQRIQCSEGVTIGELTLASLHVCFTQENTPIECGRYRIERTYSERFQKTTPMLVGPGARVVPNYPGKDMEGCIITGYDHTQSGVSDTQLGYREVIKWIATLETQNIPVWMQIKAPEGERASG